MITDGGVSLPSGRGAEPFFTRGPGKGRKVILPYGSDILLAQSCIATFGRSYIPTEVGLYFGSVEAVLLRSYICFMARISCRFPSERFLRYALNDSKNDAGFPHRFVSYILLRKVTFRLCRSFIAYGSDVCLTGSYMTSGESMPRRASPVFIVRDTASVRSRRAFLVPSSSTTIRCPI